MTIASAERMALAALRRPSSNAFVDAVEGATVTEEASQISSDLRH
jgi:hypothetical protein